MGIGLDMTRKEIINRLEAIRATNETADLAFYAYRDLNRTEPEPFLLAAIQRNPVAIEGARTLDDDMVIRKIAAMPDESIYDGQGRLAQPDEVWNYGRGDGLEKAILLASILNNRRPDDKMTIQVGHNRASLKAGEKTYDFESRKGLAEQSWTI